MFGMMDSNRDGKLQPVEIQRVLDIFTKALKASQEEPLSSEDWMDLTAELRPPGGGRPPNGPDGNAPGQPPRGPQPKNPPPPQ
jgi:hypothetical protein